MALGDGAYKNLAAEVISQGFFFQKGEREVFLEQSNMKEM